MRIGFVSIYPQRKQKHSYKGGVASYTRNLIEGLVAQDPKIKLIILADRQEKEMSYFEYKKQVRVIRTWRKGVFFCRDILKAVKKENLKILHLHHEIFLYGGVFTAFLFLWLLWRLKKERIKTIVTIHGVLSEKAINKNFAKENNIIFPVFLVKKGFLFIFRGIGRLANKIIVHEKIFKDFLFQDYGVERQKVKVVFHGVEDKKPKISQQKAKNDLKIKQKRVVLFFGYVTGYKSPEILLEAFANYSQQDKDALLIFAGGKHPQGIKNRRYLKRYQRLEKLSTKIKKEQLRWLGFIKEKQIEKIIMASDLLVFPYNMAISASGPLAFALAYQKPFLLSQPLARMFKEKKIIFKLQPDDLSKKLKEFFQKKINLDSFLKKERERRLWPNIGLETLKIYQNV